MTLRQKLLKSVYPLLMKISARKSKQEIYNERNIAPLQSFYHLKAQLNNGSLLPFESLRGKKVLLVNTASNCGFTDQYKELQQLYEQYSDRLFIIAFPSNDFKEQEKSNDEEIAQFCQINYGVTFPLAKKSSVLKGEVQNPAFQWLSSSSKNGWNNQPPVWNFSKYIANEQGVLTHFFGPEVSPLDNGFLKSLGY